MHPVDESLAFPAISATDIQFPVLPHLLRSRERLQGRHDVTAGVAGHHHVEGIHRLVIRGLSETERAGGDHHLVDGRGSLVHADGEMVHIADISRQGYFIISDASDLEGGLTLLVGGEGEPSERIGKAPVDGAHDEYVGTRDGLPSVGDGAGNEGLGRQCVDGHP